MRTSSRTGWLVRATTLFLGSIVLFAAKVPAAGPLEDFTGYSRVGYPPAENKVDLMKFVSGDKEAKGVGVTIYYMVLDREAEREKSKTVAGDTFGAGVLNFDASFVTARDSDRAKLDTEARYLYLYQVVNDSNRSAAIKQCTVKLIVDPRYITSWGHFVEYKDGKAKKGVGFSAPMIDPKAAASRVRPVSTDNPGVTDKRYRSPAPAVKVPNPFGFAPIDLGEVNRFVAGGEDGGREPAGVVLLSNAEFPQDADTSTSSTRPERIRDADTLPGVDDTRLSARLRERWRTQWPAIRAYWNDEIPLKPRERSTLFGFTSDLPPTLEAANVRPVGSYAGKIGGASGEVEPKEKGKIDVKPAGKEAESKEKGKIDVKPVANETDPKEKGTPRVKPAAGEVMTPDGVITLVAGESDGAARSAITLVTGTVPTPTPPSRPTPRATPASAETGGALAGTPAASGGLGAPLGSLGGAAPSGGGVTSAAPPSGATGGSRSGGGGFPGGGQGSGSGNGTPTSTTRTDSNQGQGERQRQFQILNNKITINVQQQQQQQQQQSGGCCCPDGNVVPAPPAWLLGLLGLPVFGFLSRRKRSSAVTTAENADVPPPDA